MLWIRKDFREVTSQLLGVATILVTTSLQLVLPFFYNTSLDAPRV
jgi:hypothetical protein